MKKTTCKRLGDREIEAMLAGGVIKVITTIYRVECQEDGFASYSDEYAVFYSKIREGFKILDENTITPDGVVFDVSKTIPSILMECILKEVDKIVTY